MNIIYSFLTTLCAVCVIIGALQLLAPEGAMSRPVKYILSLVFLAVTVCSALPRAAKIDFNIPAARVTTDEGELLSTSAEYVYAAALNNAGIKFFEITVCTDKTESGGILISKVYIRSDYPEFKVKEALGKAAENYEVVVINE